MELYQMQKVKYYLIVDTDFKKVEIYQYNKNIYEPVAVNPESFEFLFEKNCTATINFTNIWD
jgi:Uma2 family endonuclease